jgi:hypothetical protein
MSSSPKHAFAAFASTTCAHLRVSPGVERVRASCDRDPRRLAARHDHDLYSHVMPSPLRAAADVMDRALV